MQEVAQLCDFDEMLYKVSIGIQDSGAQSLKWLCVHVCTVMYTCMCTPVLVALLPVPKLQVSVLNLVFLELANLIQALYKCIQYLCRK